MSSLEDLCARIRRGEAIALTEDLQRFLGPAPPFEQELAGLLRARPPTRGPVTYKVMNAHGLRCTFTVEPQHSWDYTQDNVAALSRLLLPTDQEVRVYLGDVKVLTIALWEVRG